MHRVAKFEDFNRVMSVNAGGVMLCYKHAALQMIKQGRGGRILGKACDLMIEARLI